MDSRLRGNDKCYFRSFTFSLLTFYFLLSFLPEAKKQRPHNWTYLRV